MPHCLTYVGGMNSTCRSRSRRVCVACWPCFKDQEIIAFPSKYVLESSDDECQKRFFEEHSLQGLVVAHIVSHEQTILEDGAYSKIKELRENHLNLQYLNLCLIKENKISEFLRVFPVW